MTMTVWQSVIMIAAIILATVLTRSLPFIIFSGGRKIPPFVNYLGKVLPFAVTGMLVVYSLKDAPLTHGTARRNLSARHLRWRCISGGAACC